MLEFKARKSRGTRHQTRRIDFVANRREANVRPMGGARDRGQKNKTAQKIVSHLLTSKTLTQS